MSKPIKAVIGLTIITILSKFLGFAREIALTSTYGATSISDVYLITTSIPTVIFGAIGTSLATTFIPLFCELENKEGKEKSLKFANNVFNIVIVLTIVLAVLGFILAKPLVKIFAMDFSGEKLKLAIEFIKIMIFSVVFIGLNSILSSWLQIRGNFMIPGMIGFPNNIILIIFILLSSKRNIYLLALGVLIGLLSQIVLQLPYAIKSGYKYKLYINLKDEYIRKMLLLIVPIFIGSLVSQLNFMIDKSLASTFGDGVIAILNNGSKLVGIINGLFIGAIATVIYPELSNLSNDNNKDGFIDIVAKSINIVTIITMPIMIGAIILSNPIVNIVYKRGAFDENAANMTSIAFLIYSFAMVAYALRDILNKVFYSLKDTKTPMINGAIGVISNIILNIVLSRYLGYKGLALATSISSIICILLLFRSLNKKISYYGQDKILKTFIKSTISASIMGAITYVSYRFLGQVLGYGTIQEVITLFTSIFMGAVVYVILIILFKINEVNMILSILKDKAQRVS